MIELTNKEFKRVKEYMQNEEIDFNHTLDGEMYGFDFYSDDELLCLRIEVGVEEFGVLTHATYTNPAEFNRTGLDIKVFITEVWYEDDEVELTSKQDQDLTEIITKIVRV